MTEGSLIVTSASLSNDIVFQFPFSMTLVQIAIAIPVSYAIFHSLAGRSLIKNAIIYSVVFGLIIALNGFYSYEKKIKIESLVNEGQLFFIDGKVESVKRYSGMDEIVIAGKSFDIKHDDIYCLSGKNIFQMSDEVELKYVDLDRFWSAIYGYCILEVEINNHRG